MVKAVKQKNIKGLETHLFGSNRSPRCHDLVLICPSVCYIIFKCVKGGSRVNSRAQEVSSRES